MTKWPVQKLAQGTTQKLLQHHDATTLGGNKLLKGIHLYCGNILPHLIVINEVHLIMFRRIHNQTTATLNGNFTCII